MAFSEIHSYSSKLEQLTSSSACTPRSIKARESSNWRLFVRREKSECLIFSQIVAHWTVAVPFFYVYVNEQKYLMPGESGYTYQGHGRTSVHDSECSRSYPLLGSGPLLLIRQTPLKYSFPHLRLFP